MYKKILIIINKTEKFIMRETTKCVKKNFQTIMANNKPIFTHMNNIILRNNMKTNNIKNKNIKILKKKGLETKNKRRSTKRNMMNIQILNKLSILMIVKKILKWNNMGNKGQKL